METPITKVLNERINEHKDRLFQKAFNQAFAAMAEATQGKLRELEIRLSNE